MHVFVLWVNTGYSSFVSPILKEKGRHKRLTQHTVGEVGRFLNILVMHQYKCVSQPISVLFTNIRRYDDVYQLKWSVYLC